MRRTDSRSIQHSFVLPFAAAALVGAAGCGGSDATPSARANPTTSGTGASSSSTGGAGGGSTGSAGAGGDEIAYPAPHPSMPELTNHGGAILHDPVIVTVTFPGDALKDFVQQFDDAIGGSAWWSTIHTQYGIHAAVSGGHVEIAESPDAAITDSQIGQWLRDRIADATLPAPTDQSVYVLYYPMTTTISLFGQTSCNDFAGYHNYTVATLATGEKVSFSYAVLPRCDNDQDALTISVSHELTEAATDPLPAFGYMGYNLTKKSAWNPAGGEIADLCEFVSGTTEGSYQVTRAWSNENAKLGQQPCIPVPTDTADIPYYNGGIVNDLLTATPGATVTTEIDCYSFGPLPNAISLDTQVFSSSPLSFEFDKSTCQNGDVVNLTIHVADTAKIGTDYHYRLLSSVSDSSSHLWRGMVSVH